MKRIIFLVFTFIIVLFVASRITGTNKISKNYDNSVPKPQASQTANEVQNIIKQKPTSTPIGLPTKLIISKIGVDATVESVGQDSLGRMDVPQHVADVAWYSLGSKPGEVGNAVIDGHLDTVTGAPAVFWSLSNLAPGDQISVVDANGRTYNFVVTNTVAYDYDKLPLDQVFGPSDKAHLNLITCDGVWNQTTHNYSERIVIYSDLES